MKNGKFTLSALGSGLAVQAASIPPVLASGMPQLDFGNRLVQGQVVWGAIIFLLFYLALKYSALPRIGHVLAKRETRIKDDLKLADNARNAADQAQADMVEARKSAMTRAQARIQEMQAATRESARETARAAQERIEEMRRDQARKVQDALNDARADLPEVSAELAGFISASILGPTAQSGNADALKTAMRPLVEARMHKAGESA